MKAVKPNKKLWTDATVEELPLSCRHRVTDRCGKDVDVVVAAAAAAAGAAAVVLFTVGQCFVLGPFLSLFP